jgi:predicted nucleic acid-binding protein
VILVDTAVWVDFLNRGEAALAALLADGQVLMHPFVVGELAMGSLRQRERMLADLRRLPKASTARDDEVLLLIERHSLFGRGLGYVDAHLLASVRLEAPARLWTRDKRLHDLAEQLGIAAERPD